MFRRITSLLFGGEEAEPAREAEAAAAAEEDEEEEEDWHVVSHQEASPAETRDVEALAQLSHPAGAGDAGSKLDTDASAADAEAKGQSSGGAGVGQTVAGFAPQPKAPAEVTTSTCAHRTRSWAERHHLSRNAIQRQNRVRRGVAPQPFHLQQPGHRHLSH